MGSALAFAKLSQDWKRWITEGLECGCDPAVMANQMIVDGKFSSAISHAAVNHAYQAQHGMQMDFLPRDWKDWVIENVARGCEPARVAHQLINEGKFSPALSHAAVHHAFQALHPASPAMPAMPDIDCTRNVVQTPDRQVTILASLDVPRLVLLGGLLSDAECDALIADATARLAPSLVVTDSATGEDPDPGRTSRGTTFQQAEGDIVSRIEARLAALTGWPVDRGERLQLLQYGPGNQYLPHHDWFDPGTTGGLRHLQRGGQRLATILIYLSDVEQGGCTSFPNLGLQVAPKKGNAVFFANANAFGQPDDAVLHAGDPVVTGVKYVATKWLRMRAVV